jgi:hypothetical protein
MKIICTLFLTLLLSIGLCAAQASSAQSAGAGTDLYHVHFAKAALGKAVQLADLLKKPAPTSPMPGHSIVLRHQFGDEWDYVVIQHLGPKATVDAASPAPPAAERDLREWHNDTYASGPSWVEFSRAMGIGEASTGDTSASLYVVGTYRAAPGHRDQLEKILRERDEGDLATGSVIMRHVEGGSWQFVSITRYNSWQDHATSESKAKAQMEKGTSGWFRIRDHVASHRDTLADRIAP